MEKMCQIIIAEGNEQVIAPNGAVTNRLVQPVLAFRLPFVPSALSFHVMFVTTGYTFKEGLSFGFNIEDPEGNSVFGQAPQTIPPIGQDFDNFNLNLDVKNTAFMKVGIHTIIATIDGDVYKLRFTIEADKIYKYED
ncbi:hypothetical protein AOC36_09595 [Erysipelothrix larvae]|uniref:Uncharacterized protein n=1 Tax=Erysipelothrix larvae TaxID=1514105 RepID=A0A0X8H197_9FIRM|nr:hypothetical protein [Erysipelothrix larvae]AMC94226.1 hypothetical protein AOC36_09595 [Erysipelothrix larvae]